MISYEARYQNTKTTALAILAVIAYACDKMKLWEWIGALIRTHINLLIKEQKHLG